MDILYYSNYCKHSQRVLNTLVKNNMSDKVSFICIDKRRMDQQTNQMYIILENGKQVVMPPNVHSVPSLLVAQQNYRLLMGEEVIQHYHPQIKAANNESTGNNGEPNGFRFNSSSGGTNIISEQFTDYNMTPDELSSKGNGGLRSMHNYVSTQNDVVLIKTPDDTYQPDKVDQDVTIDKLLQKRMDEIGQNSPFTQPMVL
jgi:hypothetical protein|tara:strand:+ start:611 stop:1210 length:600 start_codon:yes stop_codon:yes gene_type:complete